MCDDAQPCACVLSALEVPPLDGRATATEIVRVLCERVGTAKSSRMLGIADGDAAPLALDVKVILTPPCIFP
jgi:hypothetical protein